MQQHLFRVLSTTLPGRRRFVNFTLCLVVVGVITGLVFLRVSTYPHRSSDSTLLISWAQRIVDSPTWGSIFFETPIRLQHESKLFSLLQEGMSEPLRYSNLAAVGVVAVGLSIAGSSFESAILFNLFFMITVAYGLVLIATPKQPQLFDFSPGIVLATLFLWNPRNLLFLSGPSWHTIALGFQVCALLAALSAGSWHSETWSSARRVLIGLLLLGSLYSSYLIPTLLVASWASWDLVTTGRSSDRSIQRTFAFWSCMVVLYAPAVFLVAKNPDLTMAVTNDYFGGVSSSPFALVSVVVSSSFLLPWIARSFSDFRASFSLIYLAVLTVLFCFILNTDMVLRAHVYYWPPLALLLRSLPDSRKWLALSPGIIFSAAVILLPQRAVALTDPTWTLLASRSSFTVSAEMIDRIPKSATLIFPSSHWASFTFAEVEASQRWGLWRQTVPDGTALLHSYQDGRPYQYAMSTNGVVLGKEIWLLVGRWSKDPAPNPLVQQFDQVLLLDSQETREINLSGRKIVWTLSRFRAPEG